MSWELFLSVSLWLYGLALVSLSFRILMKRHTVGVTLSWILFIYIIPIMGIALYLLFGERYLGRLRAKRAKNQTRYYYNWLKNISQDQLENAPIDSVLRPVMELTLGTLGLPALRIKQWQLLDTANRFFESVIEDINKATHTIFIEFYILEPKGKVLEFIEALKQASKRGVDVFVLLDSVGSNSFFKTDIHKSLIASGIHVQEVLHANLLRITLRRQDLRLHRKLISVDNKLAYTGSMNLVDPSYFKVGSGVGPWVDLMVRIEGDIANIVQGTVIFDWELETGHRLDKHLSQPTFKHSTIPELPKGPLIQLLPSGPALDDEILLQVLLTAIHNARKKIIITTPYFVPDDSLLQALKSTAKRGLDVTIIVPHRNDSKLAQYAGRSFYEELLNAGVKIMRFTGGLLHTKTVIIDDHLVLIGSVNLDMRSIWLNFEATLIVEDKSFCDSLIEITNQYKAQSHELNLKPWLERPLYKKVLENVAQLTSPLL